MPDNTPLPTADEIDEFVGREEELSTARDENDILIRRERATRKDFERTVSITIDGFPVVIEKSVPKTDAQGNPLRDEDGGFIPRRTTIYDAARKLVALGLWTDRDLKERIPVLCHMPHLHPVGVCRMCSVSVSKRIEKDGKFKELKGNRKLAPACWHEVQDGMAVNTRAGKLADDATARMSPEEFAAHKTAADKAAATIGKSLGLLAELLLADHKPEKLEWEADGTEYDEDKRYENELEQVAGVLGVTKVRPRLRKPPQAFSRNRMAEEEPSENDPMRPFTKPLRRIPLDTLAPTRVQPEDRNLGTEAVAGWEAWNRLVDEKFPYSSRTVVVDHDKCIVCDRCVRSCSEVKPFKVIGHTGKGYTTRISFDLDFLMGPRDSEKGAAVTPSSCVQCGECMTSCPTGALSLRRRVQPRAWEDSPEVIPQNPNTPFPEESGFLTADEIRKVWVYYVPPGKQPNEGRVVFPFASVPFAYLKWNEGSVRKRVIKAGTREVLGWGGEYGSTAFLTTGTGKFHVYQPNVYETNPGRIGRWLGKRKERVVEKDEFGPLIVTTPGNQLLLGEMAPLTQKPRNATIEVEASKNEPGLKLVETAPGRFEARPDPQASRDVVVYEVTRNLLDMLLRSASAREAVREVYERRAIERGVYNCKMFDGLDDDDRRTITDELLATGKLTFRRVEVGEAVVAEGDPASGFFIIRLGSVEVFKTVSGRKQILARRSDGDYIGEIALLADEMKAAGVIPAGSDQTRRTATVSALDPVEVVRMPDDVFRRLCAKHPEVRDNLIRTAISRAKGEDGPPVPPALVGEYISQGLFQAQRMLVLDLTRCTRCDECTRACSDSHPEHGHAGHARLLREGLRFGDFLVATSCRSCHKPYCMEGCPVDAIHRRGTHLEVKIENHCIGCGLCERNCPYGAIQMVARDRPNPLAADHPDGNPRLIAAGPRRAVNCDLCNGGEPYCVQACPHEAAHRVDGPTLLNLVAERSARG